MRLKTALITGASGFIGLHLCRLLAAQGWWIRAVVPQLDHAARLPAGIKAVVAARIEQETVWGAITDGVETVFHLAARVQGLRGRSANPLEAYRRINVDGTRRLAEAAARCGVRRFVYVSTVKVCGEGRLNPYRDADPADPKNPYSQSKWEAEQALAAVAHASDLQVVVLRPPLVFGPGVKSNFLKLLRFVDMGVPLPLASVHNARSMIYVGNLAEAIRDCAATEAITGGTFVVADSEAPSTPKLIRTMAAHMGRPPRLLPMPVHWLCRMGSWLGRESEIQRLVSSLVVAPEAIIKAVGWQPRCGFDQAMAATVRWYRQLRK